MAQKITVHFVRVFTTSKTKSGNLAGVVETNKLNQKEKQHIASVLNLSETVFIQRTYNKTTLEFFTPNKKIPFCGHATLAAASFLDSFNLFANSVKFDVEMNCYTVSKSDNLFFMQQDLPIYKDKIDKRLICDSLQVSTDSISEAHIVSTGLADLIIPIKSVEILHHIKPDFDKIKQISKKLRIIGYHLFALSSEPDVTAYCRNFAPLYGIQEESGTGSSSGALSCYLWKNNLKRKKYILRQGWQLENPSEIITKIRYAERIDSVLVGGQTSLEKSVSITF